MPIRESIRIVDFVIVPPPGMEKSKWQSIDYLESALKVHGLQAAADGDSPGRHTAVIVFNHRRSRQLVRILSRVPKHYRSLVVMEPEATGPSNYSRRVLAGYGHTFFASPLWASKVGGESFFWPHPIADGRLARIGPTAQRFDTTMIFANKRSASPESLYGLRREVVRAASAAKVDIALFGPDWDLSKLQTLSAGARAMLKALHGGSHLSLSEAFGDLGFVPSEWLGPIEQKRHALRLAPTTIAIENSLDFVSEKLFDPILCGVVPVYVGPDVSQFGIPHSVALLAPADSRQVVEIVRNASRNQLEEVRAAGLEWVQSGSALKFDEARVMSDLAERIVRKIQ